MSPGSTQFSRAIPKDHVSVFFGSCGLFNNIPCCICFPLFPSSFLFFLHSCCPWISLYNKASAYKFCLRFILFSRAKRQISLFWSNATVSRNSCPMVIYNQKSLTHLGHCPTIASLFFYRNIKRKKSTNLRFSAGNLQMVQMLFWVYLQERTRRLWHNLI